jgi:glutamine amidotransferase-like uncharacterized protein
MFGRCAALVLLTTLLALSTTACTNRDARPADILLFTGRGASPNDVEAIEEILERRGLHYSTVDSSGIDRMSAAQLRAYRLLIVPGGNFEVMGNSLQRTTAANIRRAVNDGLNYFGICAGAFIAGDSPYNGFNLTSGKRFEFYGPSKDGLRKAAVTISAAGEPAMDHYWEDGPQLSGWGEVVAKYPDGTPAIVQGFVGKGWMILSGVHPEAPQNWRTGMTFGTSASTDNEYAARLIEAALSGGALPHY